MLQKPKRLKFRWLKLMINIVDKIYNIDNLEVNLKMFALKMAMTLKEENLLFEAKRENIIDSYVKKDNEGNRITYLNENGVLVYDFGENLKVFEKRIMHEMENFSKIEIKPIQGVTTDILLKYLSAQNIEALLEMGFLEFKIKEEILRYGDKTRIIQ